MSSNKKAPRRVERIFAFKVLYGLCFSPVADERGLKAAFVNSPDRPDQLSEALENGYAWRLVNGVWNGREALDKTLSGFSQNWRVERIGKVELTLLRIALYELLHEKDVPPKVALNEAVELSKQFGDDKSRGFVNGILDAAAKAQESGALS